MAEQFDFDAESNNGQAGSSDASTGSGPGASGSIGQGGQTGSQAGSDPSSIPPSAKRRGRKAYPRDAEGRVIRPDGSKGPASAQASATGKTQEKLAVKSKAFVPNDKSKVANNIQGMHAAMATLTKQPVFLLKPEEAVALSSTLCDVLDYHQISLTDVGGPTALYVALGLTAFAIYKPRIDFIKSGGGQQVEQQQRATSPATPRDEMHKPKPMDFSGDITSTMTAQ